MTSAKRPDGSVDYFAQHADKPAPNIIHHPPASMKPKAKKQQAYSNEQQQKS
jgi:hypothetical protein